MVSFLDRVRPHAVPVAIFAIVAVAISIVPLLVLGAVSVRTYAITAAVVILAVGAALPYAVVVGLGTLPLLYTGIASYAAPQASSDPIYSFSPITVLRHVIAGIAYALAAAVLGAIGIGAQMGTPAGSAPGSVGGQPAFLIVGGVIIAGTFVALQLWRYGSSLRELSRGTIVGTGVLGVLIAVSPVVAFWVFNNTS